MDLTTLTFTRSELTTLTRSELTTLTRSELKDEVERLADVVAWMNDSIIRANSEDWRKCFEDLQTAQAFRDSREDRLLEARLLLADLEEADEAEAAVPPVWWRVVEPETKGYRVAGDDTKTIFKTETEAERRAAEVLRDRPDLKAVGIARLEARLIVTRLPFDR